MILYNINYMHLPAYHYLFYSNLISGFYFCFDVWNNFQIKSFKSIIKAVMRKFSRFMNKANTDSHMDFAFILIFFVENYRRNTSSTSVGTSISIIIVITMIILDILLEAGHYYFFHFQTKRPRSLCCRSSSAIWRFPSF